MELIYSDTYAARGLSPEQIDGLSALGDLLLNAAFNVTSIREPADIERFHFLDSLALLGLESVRTGCRLADLGSGAGLPALLLALALPRLQVTAVESLRKKCAFIDQAVTTMKLENVQVRCARAEEYGQDAGRGAHDVVVSRALAALPVVAEYSVPLLTRGGAMVAMKGEISNQERIQAQKALDILGAGRLESVKLEPFAGAENRWVHMATKERPTPAAFPRRPGTPAHRPLGG
jgi:16S rRNA (guanine527-N7)-methyltransferase